jgi:hypothetical protein
MTPDFDRFDAAIGEALTSAEAWKALEELARAVIGHELFTVMTVDMAEGLARRAYSDHPREYPVSGTKPVTRDAWFDIVHGERRSFIANTIEDIAKVFPDHALIASMGLGSVWNLPVVLGGELVATINMLDEPHHYGADAVTKALPLLSVPAKLCCALALRFDSAVKKPD